MPWRLEGGNNASCAGLEWASARRGSERSTCGRTQSVDCTGSPKNECQSATATAGTTAAPCSDSSGGGDATTSLQLPPAPATAKGDANASLDNKTQFLTRGGLHLLYEPAAEDKWISRQITTCEQGGPKDAQTGEQRRRSKL